MAERYIGDGLYASFDGFQFKLRAPRFGSDDEVYLDPSTLKAFNQFVEDAKAGRVELAAPPKIVIMSLDSDDAEEI